MSQAYATHLEQQPLRFPPQVAHSNSKIVNQNNDQSQVSTSPAVAVATRDTPPLNLTDIFGDCFFTPDGDTVFLSDDSKIISSLETNPTSTQAHKIGAGGAAMPVPNGGGIGTTGLDIPGNRATVMGTNNRIQVDGAVGNPMVAPPQMNHHLSYAVTAPTVSLPVVATGSHIAAKQKENGVSGSEKPHEVKRRRGREGKKMTEQQKSDRRERNREHAKRSRIRKKFLLESLQHSAQILKEENGKLRSSLTKHLGEEEASELLSPENLEVAQASLIASNAADANKLLDDPDFSFIKALQTAQQNFVVTDPSLPDNPIVYATQGFLNLTGYSLEQVLGRNCRFLQGPETDPKAVEKIRNSIDDGSDMSVCLLNYRVDGTTFWNQFFIAALRDAAGNITNYVGVQCKVSDQYASTVCKRQEEMDANSAENNNSGDGGEMQEGESPMPIIVEAGAGATLGQTPAIVDGGDKTDDLPSLVADTAGGPNMSLPMMLPPDPTAGILQEERQYDQQQQVGNILVDQENKGGEINTAAVAAQDNTTDATEKDIADAINNEDEKIFLGDYANE